MTAAFISSRPSRSKMESTRLRASELNSIYGHLEAQELLDVMIKNVFVKNIALVSSFGADAAVLLSLVAEVDQDTPIIFIETGKHFNETLIYRDKLTRLLGLRHVESVSPSPIDLSAHDPDGLLWGQNPNLCCYLRKVLPLERALSKYGSWITGRKQYQGGVRGNLPRVEASNGKIKINPIANWDRIKIKEQFRSRGLPPHPLLLSNYSSVGCSPCTKPVKAGENERAGRWSGSEKSECGIHLDRDSA